MGITTDPNDPRLGRGTDAAPTGQNEVYLVLSDEEIAKGFVRPVRHAYKHVGLPAPSNLRDLTPEEVERFGGPPNNWVKIEEFEPPPDSSLTGQRGWTQERLDKIDKGCGHVTTMGLPIAETYARDPKFYGATYCAHCNLHLPVGERGEFIWVDPVTGRDLPDERVGT